MSMKNRRSGFVGQAFALAAVLGVATIVASAQTEAPAFDTSVPAYSTSAQPELTATPSSNEVAAVNLPAGLNFMQYGGRRSGRPRYRGGNTNADGSPKYEFFGGVGLAQPVGNTYHYLNPGWAFQVGAGRNYSNKLGLDVQFDYDHFGFNKRTLQNQIALYNGIDNYYGYGTDNFDTLDGNSHIWSFTIDPKYNIYSGEGIGSYLVAGGGFYHKVADFTVPTAEEYCEYGYCEEVGVNAIVDHYTSNAPGVNAGIGFTYKFSRFSHEALYAEGRYVYMFNSQRQGATYAKFQTNPGTYALVADDYPANSNRTSYFPIKVGIRF